MIRKTVSLLDRNGKYLDMVSNVLNTTVSQVVADLIGHVREGNLEDNIWDNWDNLYESYKESLEVFEREDEGEEEEDKEEDITDILNDADPIKIWNDDLEKEEEED